MCRPQAVIAEPHGSAPQQPSPAMEMRLAKLGEKVAAYTTLAASQIMLQSDEHADLALPSNAQRSAAASTSEEAGYHLDTALEVFAFWRRCNSNSDIAERWAQAMLKPIKTAQARHRASRLAMLEHAESDCAASALAGALDCISSALQDCEKIFAGLDGANGDVDACTADQLEMQVPALFAPLRWCCTAMDMAKRMTQDALLHCVCEGDAQARTDTKKAKEIVQAKCRRAFGRDISDQLLSRLQNARHQLFVHVNGAAETELFDVCLPPSAIDDRVFQNCDDGLSLRVLRIDNKSALGQWNEQHPRKQLRVGDRIVRVDGHWGEAAFVKALHFDESIEGACVDLLVLRDPRPTQTKKKSKKKKSCRGGHNSSAAATESRPLAPVPAMSPEYCSGGESIHSDSLEPTSPSCISVKKTFIHVNEAEDAAEALRRAQSCPGPKTASDHTRELLKVFSSGCDRKEGLSMILLDLESALQINWSKTDELEELSYEVISARSVCEEVAELAGKEVPPEWRGDLGSLDAWARAETDEHFGQVKQLPMRLKVIGLLFGATTVFELLKVYIKSLDEGFVTSALRALAELKQLHLVDAAVSQEIVEAVLDNKFVPLKKHCHSARAGILGVLASGDTLTSALLDRSVELILQIVNCWLGKYNSAACLFECFWALNRICPSAKVAQKLWTKDCDAIASSVLNNSYFLYYERESLSYKDEHKLLLEARRLAAWVAS